MKKLSKACFIIAIILLVLSVTLTIVSLCNLRVSYTRSYGNYRYYYYASEISETRKLQLTIIGCTGIISALILFIISKMDSSNSCDCCSCEKEEVEVEIPKYTSTKEKEEIKVEIPTYTGTTVKKECEESKACEESKECEECTEISEE